MLRKALGLPHIWRNVFVLDQKGLSCRSRLDNVGHWKCFSGADVFPQREKRYPLLLLLVMIIMAMYPDTNRTLQQETGISCCAGLPFIVLFSSLFPLLVLLFFVVLMFLCNFSCIWVSLSFFPLV